MTQQWLSAYLYYTGDWSEFLTDGVRPFIDEMMATGSAEQYFFIRYWEHGPHIRLRFKGEDIEHHRARLNHHFCNYYQQRPSSRDDVAGVADNWFPNNSIQFIDYEPEIDRYGGDVAIHIAEAQFQASSTAILDAIATTPQWDYTRSMGVAIQMHLAMLHSFGATLSEVCACFETIYAIKPDLHAKYEAQFQAQKAVLIPHHATIWQALEADAQLAPTWLQTWQLEMETIQAQLLTAHEQGDVVLPAHWETRLEHLTGWHQLWSILASYIHMTNNRLGIYNIDEPYLGYLIKRSIEHLHDGSINSDVSLLVSNLA